MITTFVAVLGIVVGLIEDTTGFTSAAEDAIVNVSLPLALFKVIVIFVPRRS